MNLSTCPQPQMLLSRQPEQENFPVSTPRWEEQRRLCFASRAEVDARLRKLQYLFMDKLKPVLLYTYVYC